ncbi:hypothetical protein [Bradyrhizobium sp. URHC0002]
MSRASETSWRGEGPRAASPGAIVKGEHGLPVGARSYGNWFRDIARAAGIPDAVFGKRTLAPAVPPRPTRPAPRWRQFRAR